MRRDWAQDRAEIADHNRLQAVARSQEHTAFAEQMGSRIRHKDAQIETLRDSLVTAEIDLAKTRERVSAERARVDALTADLSSAQSDVESARTRPDEGHRRTRRERGRRDPGARRGRGVGAVGDR